MNIIRFGRSALSLVTPRGQPVSLRSKFPAPKVLAVPLISKAVDPAVVGTVLTYVPGVYSGPVTVTWVWKSGTTLRQTGGVSYMAQAIDVGTTITLVESATNFGGTTVTSTSGVPIT
jgi:hypothetical protein